MQSPQQILKKLNRRANRSLGQNFLTSETLVHQILAVCQLTPQSNVLEIGPGLGIMTGPLVEMVSSVTSIEADGELFAYLKQRFIDESRLEIIHGDALHTSFVNLFGDREDIQVVANLPYNVATEILFRFIEHRQIFSKICIMVQREVGLRLEANPGTKAYGRLSIIPRIYYDVHTPLEIRSDQFYPPPKVDSKFMVLKRRSQPRIDLSDSSYQIFFVGILKEFFQWRRKTLQNSLNRITFAASRSINWRAALTATNIDGRRRAETLELGEIDRLIRSAYQQIHAG